MKYPIGTPDQVDDLVVGIDQIAYAWKAVNPGIPLPAPLATLASTKRPPDSKPLEIAPSRMRSVARPPTRIAMNLTERASRRVTRDRWRRWTPEEDQRMREGYAIARVAGALAQFAADLGRDEAAVATRAHRMHLTTRSQAQAARQMREHGGTPLPPIAPPLEDLREISSRMFVGIPCLHGHRVRYKSNRGCVVCTRAAVLRSRAAKRLQTPAREAA